MKPLNKLLPHLAAISLFMLLLGISIFGSDREAGAQVVPGHGEVSDVSLLESTLALTLEWHASN